MFLFKNKFLLKSQFYFRLSSLLSSGFSIISAISNLKENIYEPEIKKILLQVGKKLSEGKTISEAVEEFPAFFSRFEIKAISSAVKSGNLPETLLLLSEYFSFFENIRKKFIEGLTYPFILLNLAIFIPAIPVLFLKGLLSFIAKIFFPLVIIYGGFFIFLFFPRWVKKNDELRKLIDGLLIKVPLSGKILISFQTVQFLRSFVTLYKAGVDVVNSFRIATEIIGNEIIKKEFSRNLALLEKNIPVSEAIKNNPFLSDSVKEMIETGQISGSMDEAIEKVVEYTERETYFLINQIVKVLPVFIYLLVAAYVGYIIVSFYSGYIKTINSLL